jgi:hypothetical protein
VFGLVNPGYVPGAEYVGRNDLGRGTGAVVCDGTSVDDLLATMRGFDEHRPEVPDVETLSEIEWRNGPPSRLQNGARCRPTPPDDPVSRTLGIAPSCLVRARNSYQAYLAAFAPTARPLHRSEPGKAPGERLELST